MPDEDEPAEPGSAGPPAREERNVFVVGIGASAGGLEAIEELIRQVPGDGMAYIVVQHLAPDHASSLTHLIARSSRMQVVTASDGMALEPDHVYVIPPNADLTVTRGVIRITKPPVFQGRGPHLPVDHLFRSLAEDKGHSAIGIVLSGTGTDGTLGLKAIKAAGGLTFVQEPTTTKYDGMPRSAWASGAADYCLPLKEIAEELARIGKRAYAQPSALAREPAPVVQDHLGKLFVLIQAEFGNDLNQYKQATLDRRIERRMLLHDIERLADYVKYVRENRDELKALYEDLLISVTKFFREPEAFEALKTKVFPQLLEHKAPNQPIRVWVPACATGEEAYSIAMCLLEFCEDNLLEEQIQIFGTDVDEESIQHARRGVYPVNISIDVSPERLDRFFVKKDNEFQIGRRTRDILLFSRQNVIRDAQFSHIDLVSCRNLLIYLQQGVQKKVLRRFHYALNPTGHILLGNSETAGDVPELFSPVDRKNKIYVKRLVAPQTALEVGFRSHGHVERARSRPTLSLQGLADRKVLELYGPPGVVVSEKLDILQFRGHSGPFLDPAPGSASLNILKVARFDLRIGLTRALHQARSERVRVTTALSYQEDGKPGLVKIDVVPLQDPGTGARCFLVLFQRMPLPKEVAVASPEGGKTDEILLPLVQRNQELEHELNMTREYVQAMFEEKESANEELYCSNEALQSTNEELESSKEALQSTNVELTTLNDELHERMKELSQTNDDLYNVLAGVDNAVVIVGMDLRIRRFTSAAEKLLDLVPGDLGRSISFLNNFLGVGAVEAKVRTVVQGLSTWEEEILASNRRWYALKVSPYKALNHAVRGAVVTLVDIDVRKRAMDTTRDAVGYAARFLGAIGHPLLIFDRSLRVVWANEAFLSTFQLSAEETVGSPLASLGANEFAEFGLCRRLEGVFVSMSSLRNFEIRLQTADGNGQAVWVGASLIPASEEMPLALLSLEPTTQAAS